jgi:hypothetical protein
MIENEFLRSHLNVVDLVHNAPIAIHVVNNKGIIKYANKRELELVEYATNEYIGHRMSEVRLYFIYVFIYFLLSHKTFSLLSLSAAIRFNYFPISNI